MIRSRIGPKISYFFGKIVKFLCKNREKLENISLTAKRFSDDLFVPRSD